MGLLGIFFKKKQNLDNINDFKIFALTQEEAEAIEEYSNYISNILPLHITDLNVTHILHPDNLIRFGEMWFNTKKENRIIQVDEDSMINYLGASLGKYVHEKYNLSWYNVANMKVIQNENVKIECALVDDTSSIIFFPTATIFKEIREEKGLLEKELNRIKPLVKSSSSFRNKDKMSFEELIRIVKENGKGEDVVNIWKTVLGLKEWNFISVYKENIQDNQPFIGVIDSKPWFFVFTSRQKAHEFTKSDSRFLGPKGETYIISQSVENSLKMIFEAEKNGVFGIMMNENDSEINSNFNIPIATLKRIIQIIENKK